MVRDNPIAALATLSRIRPPEAPPCPNQSGALLPAPIDNQYCRSMPVSDLEIQRQARLWLQLHRDEAIATAREIVETMRAKGDEEGADTWLRIIVAITELGTPLTGARH